MKQPGCKFFIDDLGLAIILQPMPVGGTLDPPPGLPSWALDWRSKYNLIRDVDVGQRKYLPKFVAEHATQNNYAEFCLTSWSIGKIRVAGLIFDNLDKIPKERRKTWLPRPRAGRKAPNLTCS